MNFGDQYSRVMIFGNDSTIGNKLVELYLQSGRTVKGISYQQLTEPDAWIEQLKDFRPQLIINACDPGKGVGFHQKYPADMSNHVLLYQTKILPNCNLKELKKFVLLLPNCTYPADIPIPMAENYYWSGAVHSSVFAFATAKKSLVSQARGYQSQHDVDLSLFAYTATYDQINDLTPNEDDQVIPTMIKKILKAKNENTPDVSFWGSGIATREFIYSSDAAIAICHGIDESHETEIINIGTGEEVSMKKLVSLVVDAVEYKGKIIWDTSKPEGKLRKVLDTGRMEQFISYRPEFTLAQGIRHIVKGITNGNAYK